MASCNQCDFVNSSITSGFLEFSVELRSVNAISSLDVLFVGIVIMGIPIPATNFGAGG